MNRSSLIGPIINFVVLLFAQVLVFGNLSLYNTAFCFAYVLFVLALPPVTSRVWLLLSAFFLGLLVDVFEDTLGINAAACVFIAYLKPYVIRALDNQSGTFEENAPITVSTVGVSMFALFTFIMVFIHCLVFFYIEAAGFHLFWRNMAKAFFSADYTVVVILIIQFIFYPSGRSR